MIIFLLYICITLLNKYILCIYCAPDYALRHGVRAERKESCKGINAMLAFNQLAYTAQPVPTVSRVDLAAMFLHREAFRATNLLFGKSFFLFFIFMRC